MKIDSASVASRLGVSIDRLAETIEVGGARTEKILLSVENKHGTDEYLNWLESVKAAPAPAPADEVISAIIPTEPAAETVPPRQKPRKAPANDIPDEEEFEEIPLEPVDAIPCNGTAPRISIMGQPKAELALQGYINAFHASGEFPQSVLITGPAGVGKSHACEEIKKAFSEIEDKEINFLEISNAAQLAITASEESESFIAALKNSAYGIYTIIFLDEAQQIGRCGEAMKRIINGLIFGAGQGWARSGSVPFQGRSIPFNSRFLSLVLITNQPEKVMKGNQSAFERRFKCIELERYSPAIMRKLTVSFFEAKGITVEKSALTELVKIHRGTLEALCDFEAMAAGHHNGAITREIFDRILPLCKFSLRGFKRDEITALQWLSTTEEPRTKFNLLQNFPQLDLGEFYRHATGQQTKLKGKEELAPTPFVRMAANQYEVTGNAQLWLKKL